MEACQSSLIGTTTFSGTCLPVTEAVEGVEDYISLSMLQDLSTGHTHRRSARLALASPNLNGRRFPQPEICA